jgi:hypothetical protein
VRGRVALIAAVLAGGCASNPPPGPLVDSQGRMRVSVVLEHFVAFDATEDEGKLSDIATGLLYGARFFAPGDELWFVVAGRDPANGEIAHTLPEDLFWTLYSESDAEEGREVDLPPQELWTGVLAPGESAELTLVALEHDGARADDVAPGKVPDTVIATMREAHGAAREVASRMARETVAADTLVGTSAPVAPALGALLGGTANQLVGAFAVRVANEAGALVAEWRALDGTRDRGYSRFGRGRPLRPRTFRLGGSGSHYEAVVRVNATP